MSDIDSLISIWSMRPPPLSSHGEAWERGARQGWEWAQAEIERLKNELAKAQFQPNNRKLTRDIIRALILEIKTLRLELRQAQVMQVKNDR